MRQSSSATTLSHCRDRTHMSDFLLILLLFALLLPAAYAYGFEDGRREALNDVTEMERELYE